MSKLYVLKRVQKIPAGMEEVWNFFSRPSNLFKITPPSMQVNNISPHNGGIIYQGQILEYKLKPLMGITVYWMTEITHVVNEKYFVDELRAGPFSMWRHQHHFKKIDDGVEMTDIIHYKIPLWIFGDLVNLIFIRRELKKLFDYRSKRLKQLFGSFVV